MNSKIKYGIYANPRPDADGNTVYHVRQEPSGTMDTKEFLGHLDYHHTFRSEIMQGALTVLRNEIVEQLKANNRFRIDGIGSFQLRLGLRQLKDDDGNRVKPHYTNSKDITADKVCVEGIIFTPDPSLVDEVSPIPYFENNRGRDCVNKSKQYTRQEIVNFLNEYLAENGSITLRVLRLSLGLTDYAARKWMRLLTTEEFPKYEEYKMGNTTVYRRFGNK